MSTAMWGLSLLGIASFVAWGWQPDLRFQPTIVGILWGFLFLSGYLLGGVGRGQFGGLILALPTTFLSWLGVQSLTDLGAADCLLLSTILVVGGWSATFWKPANRPFVEGLAGQRAAKGLPRWSIWDMGCVTAVVACIVHAAPRLETPPMLLCAVAAALFSGLLCSWIACSWAWHDDWNWWSLSALVAALVAGVGIVHLSAPAGLTLTHSVRWALSGPINVVAAQGLAVLAVLTIWRWEYDGLATFARKTTQQASISA